MVETPGEFARELRSLREAQGLSVRALASLVGVSSVTVWKWENGGSKPRARMFAPLAKALDVSPGQLQSPGTRGAGAQGGATAEEGQGPEDAAMLAEGGSADPLEPLADVIARAKQMIAEASGTGSNNITILIEY